jgi:fructoselysine-6-P-deglycase FrlB-like protein
MGDGGHPVSFTENEIGTQPETWSRAADAAVAHRSSFPRAGERVAVVGCGTSWFMAMSYASLREDRGSGVTYAFAGSEVPALRSFDRLIAISRSGTTTEMVDVLRRHRDIPTLAITAVPDSPVGSVADETIVLPFADEESVVQTRFATSALALLRVSLGEDLAPAVADAARALAIDVSGRTAFDQITFLGRNWTIGLANEAALKLREAAQFWTEAYPAMDYRHGPISIAEPGRAVWSLGAPPLGLSDDVVATGAQMVFDDLDPMAALILVQRTAVAIATAKGLDPDRPRNLTRAVLLGDGAH